MRFCRLNRVFSYDIFITQKTYKINICLDNKKGEMNRFMPDHNKITDKKRTLIFINIIITCVATSLLQTALTTALPPITADFGISLATSQWLTSAYSLVMAIMMPLTAYLITRIPTRKLYLSVTIVFLVGTGICTVAPSFAVLMIGRVFQACSNGITSSIAQVILLSIYPEEKRGSIMGWYGLSVGAAPVIAPTLAGILVDLMGWRMIFICAFVIMLISFVYAFLVLGNVLETTDKKFDVSSFMLSAFAFGGLTLGIGNVSGGILRIGAWLPMAVGIVSAAVFIRRQLHLSAPFLELRTFKSRNFSLSVINSMLLYLVMMGTSVMLPIYVQNLIGYSATVSGLVMLPGSLAMTFISPVAGRLYDKFGMKRLAVAGAFALFAGVLGMCFITLETPLVVAVVLNAVRNMAIGCLMMPFVTWGIANTESRYIADATALINSLRTIAGAIGMALFVGIMNFVSVASADSYGVNAGIHGMRVSYGAVSVIAAAMVFVSLFCIKSVPKSKRTYN